MNEYMMLFRGGYDEMKAFSPEAMQAHMEVWRRWMGQLSEQGVFLGGEPLVMEGKLVSGKGGAIVKDGPFAESKEAIGGYVAIKAVSIEQAVELTRGCPLLEVGGEVELRPISKMMAPKESGDDAAAGTTV